MKPGAAPLPLAARRNGMVAPDAQALALLADAAPNSPRTAVRGLQVDRLHGVHVHKRCLGRGGSQNAAGWAGRARAGARRHPTSFSHMAHSTCAHRSSVVRLYAPASQRRQMAHSGPTARGGRRDGAVTRGGGARLKPVTHRTSSMGQNWIRAARTEPGSHRKLAHAVAGLTCGHRASASRPGGGQWREAWRARPLAPGAPVNYNRRSKECGWRARTRR